VTLRPSIYLDCNATAPVRPEVADAVATALRLGGNPSSVHGSGRAARREVERAREAVAALVGAAPETVIFTSGGTEANHLALYGSGRARIVASAIEHDSVRQAVPDAAVLPVGRDGVADLDALERLLAADARPTLVSLMLANNETGILQPVAEAAAIAHRHGALLHCDAVQAAGKLAVDRAALGADYLTLSAHKLGGPQGVGALVAAAPLEAVQRGGGQERGRRAGTENVPGIVGFGVAAALARRGLGELGRIAALRDRAECAIEAAWPDAVIFGRDVARLPNTSCIAMPGVPAETQVMALDLAGIMVSAGAACSSGKVRPSHVLDAMGVGEGLAASAIRVSFGWDSSAADADSFVAAWLDLHARIEARRSAA
jgi:cysteine desulfurase